jgi:chorismate synthase
MHGGFMRFLTAGESHGPALTVILEGCPAGLALSPEDLNRQLQRRQRGAGRGARQRIESDQAEILSGVRHGETLGTPITLLIRNKDFANWRETMSPLPIDAPPDRVLSFPRPGHADLAGALKYDRRDARDILERASARETAARVAAGAVASKLLACAGIRTTSCVIALGEVESEPPSSMESFLDLDPELPMADPRAALRARELISEAAAKGDTLGGKILVAAWGVPPGLGSHVQWDRRLDARIGAHFLSIPSVKGVEIGEAAKVSRSFGSAGHDPIAYQHGRGFVRPSNLAGGLEGGISNGEPIRVIAALKPLSTLMKPLPSVDLETKAPGAAHKERSDVCALAPAAVIGEALLALCLADALLEKFGGDTMKELLRNLAGYRAQFEAY